MFKLKSKFNPRNKDAAIELYLSILEEKIRFINKKKKFRFQKTNLTIQQTVNRKLYMILKMIKIS